MSVFRLSSARKGFGKLWWLLDATRRTFFNLLFLVIVVALIVAWVKSGPPAPVEKTALVFDLHGSIVEQKAGNLRDSALGQLRGSTSPQQIQLRDVLMGLDAAAKDPKIERLVLLPDGLDDAGMATLHEVAAAIDRFKASGKQVVAWGSSYDQRQYYLAAHADQVFLHPLGNVSIEGFGRLRNYYRDALDRLGVTVNLFRVGTYKSFAEPYIGNSESPAAREADTALYGALWMTYTDGVEHARKLPAGSVMQLIDELPQRFAAAHGDFGALVLTEKFVDGLKTRDELRQMLIERGAKDDTGKTFRQISFDNYLALQHSKSGGDAVGVVVAEGEIIDGDAVAGTIGGRSTAALIRKAREDEHIKALVLRVNSPGGSAFGAELVRRELELTRAAGKPVVVSMGDVAASGGYWIATSCDELIADSSTITGSIGVFGLLPTADKALDKIGVHTDGVSTTWLGNAGDPRRALDPRFGQVMQAAIDRFYVDFTTRVAQARKTTPEKIDAVAQGRVWTGAQAKERGLVDRLGSYGDALDAAASLGKLDKGYRIAYVESERGRFARVADMFTGALAQALGGGLGLRLGGVDLPPEVAREVTHDLSGLVALARQRPFTAIVHCLCSSP